MFDVTLNGNTLTCNMIEKAEMQRLIKVSDMGCQVTITLPFKPAGATAKALREDFAKEFNSIVKSKSGPFLKDISNKINAIAKVYEKHGAVSEKQRKALSSQSFLEKEEKEIVFLWQRWSTKLAERLALEAMDSIAKKSKDTIVAGMAGKKLKAIGKVTAVPALSLTAAALSMMTGNVAGAMSGAFKAASSGVKLYDDLSSALNVFRQDQAAIEKDMAGVQEALKTMGKRIQSLVAQRKAVELQMTKLVTLNKVLLKELATVRNTDAKAAVSLQASIDDNKDLITALGQGLPDVDGMKSAFGGLVAEHKRLVDASGGKSTEISKTTQKVKSTMDGLKESLSIIDKVT